MTPRRTLALGMALGALAPFAVFGLVGAVLLALTQPPFAAAFGIDRWLVHPWLSLAGAAAALWPLAVATTGGLMLALRAAELPGAAAAGLAALLAWAGLAAVMAGLGAGGAGRPVFPELLGGWAITFAPPTLLAAAALELGPRLVRRLARGRLDPGGEGGYRRHGEAGRTS